MDNINLYEQDFNAWISTQIHLLKQGKISELDITHLITELEDMGKSQRRELLSHLKILIAHLLKWQFQLAQLESYEGKSWRRTIIEQRSQLKDLLDDMPSLKPEIATAIIQAYPKAVMLAVDETGLDEKNFPTIVPVSQKEYRK